MKLTDWLVTMLTPVFKDKKDLELFLSASDLKSVDIPEDVEKSLSKAYLTRESALSDEELAKKFTKDARGMVFGSVDQKIKKLLPLLTEDDQKVINAEPDTLVKIELLNNAITNANKSEDVKKISAKARTDEETFRKQITELEASLKKKDDDFSNKEKDIKLDYALRNKINGITLAKEFANDQIKTSLAEAEITKLKKNFVLQFDESDQSIIHLRKNVEGVIKDHYEGNQKVTLDDVLKKDYEPFIVKSNGEHTTTTEKKEIKLPSDKPVNGMSLAELRKSGQVVGF